MIASNSCCETSTNDRGWQGGSSQQPATPARPPEEGQGKHQTDCTSSLQALFEQLQMIEASKEALHNASNQQPQLYRQKCNFKLISTLISHSLSAFLRLAGAETTHIPGVHLSCKQQAPIYAIVLISLLCYRSMCPLALTCGIALSHNSGRWTGTRTCCMSCGLKRMYRPG